MAEGRPKKKGVTMPLDVLKPNGADSQPFSFRSGIDVAQEKCPQVPRGARKMLTLVLQG